MNILFIHEVDWLKKVVYEIHALPELLSLAGHNVYFIDYESMWTKDNFFDFGSLRTKRVNGVARTCQNTSIELIHPGFIKVPVVSRLSAFFTQYFEIKRTIKEKKIDVIVLYSVPTNGLQSIALARKFGVPILFRSIDVLNQLVPNKLLSEVTRWLEKIVYPRVDLILTINNKLSQYVVAMGAQENKVRLLPLGVDNELFSPRQTDKEIGKQYGISDGDPVIVFVGTLPNFSGLDTFIRKFPEILKEVPRAKLLIVGDGIQRVKLERIINEVNLSKHVIITGLKPYEAIPDYINLATICLNPFSITGATETAFPTKIVQYLACGKTVLSTALLGLTTTIGKEQGVVYFNNPNEMINKTISLLKFREERQYLEQAAVSYIRKTHNYDNIIQQLENELNTLVRRKCEYSFS